MSKVEERLGIRWYPGTSSGPALRMSRALHQKKIINRDAYHLAQLILGVNQNLNSAFDQLAMRLATKR